MPINDLFYKENLTPIKSTHRCLKNVEQIWCNIEVSESKRGATIIAPFWSTVIWVFIMPYYLV